MAVLSASFTEQEDKLIKSWHDAKSAKVTKDFTTDHKGRFALVRKGTISHRYQNCYFHFYDEDGNEVQENIVQVALNKKYFEKINF